MSEAWQRCTIADLIERDEAEVQTGPFGTQLRASDYVESGTPVINVRNVGFGDVRPDKLEYIGEDTVARLSSHLLSPGDIVFGRKGAVERHAFIQDQHSHWFQGSDCIRLRLNSERVLSRFVSYSFLTEAHKHWMLAQGSHGATMASLNQDIIGRIPLALPPVQEQQRIVDVLSAYDKLIENNTRRIAILEEMAQAIYREWFVNFRFPGHDQVEMVETEVGAVPAGWESLTLEDVCLSICDGDWIETKDQGGEDYRLLQVSNIGTGGFRETGNYRYVTAGTFERLRCQEVVPGDILISRMPDPIGRAWLVTPMPWRMITAVDVAIAKPNPERVTSQFLLHYLNSPAHTAAAAQRATGTTRLRISRRVLAQIPLVLPPIHLQRRFQQFAADCYSLAANLRASSDNLRSARDLLLPRLMSGEIEVPEVEAVLAGAAS
jgi:type I restriction enzyme S subunit